MKTYPIQQTQAQLSGIQQAQANQWIHLLLHLVKQALADCGELPARKNEDINVDEDKAGLFVHDGTERPINRPQDPQEQHLYYSGKQKQHTLKNDIVIDEPCKIRFLSDPVEGKKNDKRLADESGYCVPKDSVLVQDAGFQGFHLDEVSILQPKKKPRGGAVRPFSAALAQSAGRVLPCRAPWQTSSISQSPRGSGLSHSRGRELPRFWPLRVSSFVQSWCIPSFTCLSASCSTKPIF